MADQNPSNLAVFDSRSLEIKYNRRKDTYKAFMKGVEDDVLVLSDRPFHTALDMPIGDFIIQWDDIFEESNPNGVFTFSSGKKRTKVVAEMFNPVLSKNHKNLKFDLDFSDTQLSTNKAINQHRDFLTGSNHKGNQSELYLDGFGLIGSRPQDAFSIGHLAKDSGILIENNSNRKLEVLFGTFDGRELKSTFTRKLFNGDDVFYSGSSQAGHFDIIAFVQDITTGNKSVFSGPLTDFSASNPLVGKTMLQMGYGSRNRFWSETFPEEFTVRDDQYPSRDCITYPYDLGLSDENGARTWTITFQKEILDQTSNACRE